jgi:dephospho-CoA kinase
VRVGLTGGIASGKTAVSNRLRDLGAYVIDADVLARDVVQRGQPALAALVERFGGDILTAAGSLDRAKLAGVVFADKDARRDAESIIHPAVRRRAAELEAVAPAGAVVVHVIPLLVETGQADDFDVVVVVDVAPEVQISRLRARNGLDEAAARARLAAQATRAERLDVADVIIDNSGDLQDLHNAVDKAWRRISNRPQGEPPLAPGDRWPAGPTQ